MLYIWIPAFEALYYCLHTSCICSESADWYLANKFICKVFIKSFLWKVLLNYFLLPSYGTLQFWHFSLTAFDVLIYSSKCTQQGWFAPYRIFKIVLLLHSSLRSYLPLATWLAPITMMPSYILPCSFECILSRYLSLLATWNPGCSRRSTQTLHFASS